MQKEKNNQLKILQIIQRSQLRGAEIFACQLSEQLQQQGHEVDILVLFGKPSDVFKFPLRFHFLEAQENKRWWDFGGYKKLHAFIDKGAYQIVQANAGDTLKYASLSKKLFGWKATLVFRNANKISGFINGFTKKALNRWLMNEVDFVASVSEVCKQDFLSVFPGFNHKIATLPIGVNPASTKPYSSLREIGITAEGPFLLNVAGFMPEKNHAGLLRIFKQVIQQVPDTKLLLIGEGKLKSSIEQLAFDMKLTDSVVFLGKRNDVQQIMGACDAFVLPSLIEGLPGVILESFVNRLPVIANDTGGIKEVVINQKTGWLIEPGNEMEFIKAVVSCLQTDNAALLKNAEELVKEKYSNSVIVVDFLKTYQLAMK